MTSTSSSLRRSRDDDLQVDGPSGCGHRGPGSRGMSFRQPSDGGGVRLRLRSGLRISGQQRIGLSVRSVLPEHVRSLVLDLQRWLCSGGYVRNGDVWDGNMSERELWILPERPVQHMPEWALRIVRERSLQHVSERHLPLGEMSR